MRFYIPLLIAVIIGVHIAMWTSDMPRELALRLTIINALGWMVILVPAWAVSKWAAAHKKAPGKDQSEI